MSRGRSYIIHPRGVAVGVKAKNLTEQKLSSVLGQSELNASSSSFHPLCSASFFFSFFFYSIYTQVFRRFWERTGEKRDRVGACLVKRSRLEFIRFSVFASGSV